MGYNRVPGCVAPREIVTEGWLRGLELNVIEIERAGHA